MEKDINLPSSNNANLRLIYEKKEEGSQSYHLLNKISQSFVYSEQFNIIECK